ncbi:Kelch repeat-containing protein [Sorangium cellulosum]|uniref:Kelch repeat-containing protein n=1 Tax=Sorangium cellulosum TaxID=56 RepID=UPI003D9A4563
MHLSRASIHALAVALAVSAAAACGDDGEGPGPADDLDTDPAPSDYTALPEPLAAFAARVLDDHLYIHGGHIGEAHDSSVESLIPNLRRLDLSKPEAAWEEVAGPDVPVQQSALFTHEGKLYRLGGMTSRSHRGEELDLLTLDDFAVYDAEADAWTALPSMPDSRSSLDVQIVGSTLYVTGGWKIDGGTETETYYETFLSIDLAADELAWEEHPQPFKVRDHCGGVVDGKLYILGGMLSGVFPTEAQIYDPATETWSEGPALPTQSPIAGFGCAAVSLNDTIYFTAAEGVVYRLNDARDGWEQVATLKTPRILHRLVDRNANELIALGGGVGEANEGTASVESILLE